MRSLALFVGTVIVLGGSAIAQEQSDVEKAVERVKEKFHLNDEQARKLKEVLESSKKKLDEAMKAAEEAVKGIVGEENFKQAMELIQKQWDRGADRRGRGDRGDRQGFPGRGDPSQFLQRFYRQMFERVQTDLGMNEEQTEKVKKIWEKFANDVQKMIEDMRNSPDGFNWQDAMQQMRQKGEEAINEMKSHLDDEQKQKLDDLLNRMRQFGGFGGNRGSGGDRGQRLLPPEERIKDAVKALNLGDSEEDKAVKDKIAQVVKLQDDLNKMGREDRPKLIAALEKETNEDEIAAKVEEFINTQLKLESKLKAARRELLEMVADQPKWAFELIKRGIL